MIISSFNRDKKMSSHVIALVSSESGPNRIIIYPFEFQRLVSDGLRSVQFQDLVSTSSFDFACKFHAKSNTYGHFFGTAKILSG